MYRLLLLLPCVAAFMGQPLVTRAPTSSSSLHMGGGSGYASTPAGKEAKVKTVRDLLEKSQMVVSVPSGGMKVGECEKLRRSMPEGTTVSTVKNTLMKRALEGTEYEGATSLLEGPNMWFFIEEDLGASIKAFTSFAKDYGKTDSHPLRGGVYQGELLDGPGVDAIGQLPSKDELYAMIARSIKAVPTKLARVVKAPNTKLARAIKLATEKNEE